MVNRIKGFYEYDDGLTPGNRKGGGLHHNLFDRDGNLKGNARFIPHDEQVDKTAPEVIHETVYVHETIYVHAQEYEQRQAREREETAKLIADVIRLLVAEATPHAQRLWHEKARPVIEARRAKAAERKSRKAEKAGNARTAAAEPPDVIEATVVDIGRELVVTEAVYRRDMSSVEAQARYLAALAARAFSDEQMQLVSSANIVYGDGLADLQRTLAKLPSQQVKGIIEAAAATPPALNGGLLAELAEHLALDQVEPQAIPEAKRRGPRWSRH